MKMEKIEIVTGNMGSCRCGDVFCVIYNDGTVEYTGLCQWQRGARHTPVFETPERYKRTSQEVRESVRVDAHPYAVTAYYSQLTEADYLAAMKKLAD